MTRPRRAMGDRIRIMKVDVEANPHIADRHGVKVHEMVQVTSEILAVAVMARSLLTDRSGTTMVRAPRDQETRCAATR